MGYCLFSPLIMLKNILSEFEVVVHTVGNEVKDILPIEKTKVKMK